MDQTDKGNVELGDFPEAYVLGGKRLKACWTEATEMIKSGLSFVEIGARLETD